MPTKKQLQEIISIQTEIVKLGLDLGGTMALIVDRIPFLIEADGAAIEFAEENHMVYRAASGIASAQLGLRIGRDNSLSGLCVRTGKILRCDDSEIDNSVDREACRQVGLRSMVVVPLSHNKETVGVLKAMSALPGKFSEGNVRVLGLLSEVIAAAMYYATKYDINELFFRATHDSMTRLANRALFVDRLHHAMAQQRRRKQAASVLIIDMNGLKQLNDQYGHRVGDAAITEFANRLKAVARHSDTVARIGGDEFGIILSPVDLPAGIEATIQRIHSQIKPPLYFEGRHYQLGASIGAAEYPADGDDIEHLLEVADTRMYQAKRAHYGNLGHA